MDIFRFVEFDITSLRITTYSFHYTSLLGSRVFRKTFLRIMVTYVRETISTVNYFSKSRKRIGSCMNAMRNSYIVLHSRRYIRVHGLVSRFSFFFFRATQNANPC